MEAKNIALILTQATNHHRKSTCRGSVQSDHAVSSIILFLRFLFCVPLMDLYSPHPQERATSGKSLSILTVQIRDLCSWTNLQLCLSHMLLSFFFWHQQVLSFSSWLNFKNQNNLMQACVWMSTTGISVITVFQVSVWITSYDDALSVKLLIICSYM